MGGLNILNNYIVIESEDIEKYLSELEGLKFSNLNEKMRDGRQNDGKTRVPEIQHKINEIK